MEGDIPINELPGIVELEMPEQYEPLDSLALSSYPKISK